MPNMRKGYPSSDKESTKPSKRGVCPDIAIGDTQAQMPQPRKRRADKEALGKRIREARMARHVSQTELARLAGVKPHTMWRYEDGQNEPGAQKLDKIAQVLGVPQGWLLHGGPPPPGLDPSRLQNRETAEERLLSHEEQLHYFNDLDLSPQLRWCWSEHVAGIGAHQKITPSYVTRFLDVAQTELNNGTAVKEAAERAGAYVLNYAIDEYARLAKRKKANAKIKRG